MADFTRLTVLVVENNPYVRALIHGMLTAFGVRQIAEAESCPTGPGSPRCATAAST